MIISVATEVSNQMGAGHFVGSYNIGTRRRLRYEGEYLNFKRKTSTRKKLIQPVFFKIQAGKTFSYHVHVLVTLHVQFLCSDWLKFDR